MQRDGRQLPCHSGLRRTPPSLNEVSKRSAWYAQRVDTEDYVHGDSEAENPVLPEAVTSAGIVSSNYGIPYSSSSTNTMCQSYSVPEFPPSQVLHRLNPELRLWPPTDFPKTLTRSSPNRMLALTSLQLMTHFCSSVPDKQPSTNGSASTENLSTEAVLPEVPGSTPDSSSTPPAIVVSHSDGDLTVTANGSTKSGSGHFDSSAPKNETPPIERKNKFGAFSRIFKPWKWRRRKKASDKIEQQAVGKLKICQQVYPT